LDEFEVERVERNTREIKGKILTYLNGSYQLAKNRQGDAQSKTEGFTSNPIMCDWLPQSGLQACQLHAKEKACLSTKNEVRKVTEKKNYRHVSCCHCAIIRHIVTSEYTPNLNRTSVALAQEVWGGGGGGLLTVRKKRCLPHTRIRMYVASDDSM
jgi:hypothetical protein